MNEQNDDSMMKVLPQTKFVPVSQSSDNFQKIVMNDWNGM